VYNTSDYFKNMCFRSILQNTIHTHFKLNEKNSDDIKYQKERKPTSNNYNYYCIFFGGDAE
jgi:hypothetical protein